MAKDVTSSFILARVGERYGEGPESRTTFRGLLRDQDCEGALLPAAGLPSGGQGCTQSKDSVGHLLPLAFSNLYFPGNAWKIGVYIENDSVLKQWLM